MIGFDDLPEALTTRPALSTLRQPIEAMGREAVRILVEEMAAPGAAPQRVVFAPELVTRESTGGAAEAAAGR